jgi:DUF883 C-terminal glycine zipper region
MLETMNSVRVPAQDPAVPGEASPENPPASLTASADQALQSAGQLYNALDAVVSKHVRDNPYATLAAAAGVGFVLGGGMRSPIGQVLLRLSVRAFGPPLVSAALHNAVERAQAATQP